MRSANDETVRLSRCTAADAAVLARLGRETYLETFDGFTSDRVMRAYLDEAFRAEKILSQLETPCSCFWLLTVDGEPAGYLKLNFGSAQSHAVGENGCEIERVYLKASLQGRGLGRLLIERAEQAAREAGGGFLWLSVWEKNGKGVGFYEALGFRKAGTLDFYMADERQTDHLMRLELT